MPIYQYDQMSASELIALPKLSTVAVVSVGPFEEHGPYLPICTDHELAQYFSKKLIETLSQEDSNLSFLVLPTLYAGADTFEWAGSIEIKQQTLRHYLYAHCSQLAKDGFKKIILVSIHSGAKHVVVLEEIASKLKWRHKVDAIVPSAKVVNELLDGSLAKRILEKSKTANIPFYEQLQENIFKDFHGGFVETSLMMHVSPKAVRSGFEKAETKTVSSAWRISRSTAKKLSKGTSLGGYIGSPQFSSKELGKIVEQEIFESILPGIRDFISGKPIDKQFRSKLYYIPFLRTDFWIVVVLALYLSVFGVLWVLLSQFAVESFK